MGVTEDAIVKLFEFAAAAFETISWQHVDLYNTTSVSF